MSVSLSIATTTILSLHLLLFLVNANSSMDPYKVLNLILNPNGTVTRLQKFPQSPPSPDPNLPTPALSKDITINQSKHTWARIYLPHKPHSKKLPLIIFYHGGGFIFYSAASTYFHDFCANLSNKTQSVVVSLEYRLAPEHRLPAAYEDSVEVLHWIKTSNDAWLTRYADYSRCYLMGESAGGTIAYNAGLRAAAIVDEIKPISIKGLILIQPFFGGTKRTPSEIRLEKDLNLPLIFTDALWELSLPVGVDRDYVYSNPMVNGGDKVLEKIKLFGWKVGVFGCDGDQLVDRQRGFVKLLEGKSVNVVGQFYSGGRHGIFIGVPSMSEKVFDLVKSFH
ncbi:carboxylesterase 1 [Lathyrus oleraceus]|uniref:Alpha/beta hydrolase fold-3 domain-containing protein n=1 Tax=Pisum sativum TaxID=3888 RepID=A0A9D4WGW5_PEA|nr:carboxylesterase 1-like [Pisum sativum]KAI5400615.1 hypothetical protein KIW84_065485 [Pisum sativum]